MYLLLLLLINYFNQFKTNFINLVFDSFPDMTISCSFFLSVFNIFSFYLVLLRKTHTK